MYVSGDATGSGNGFGELSAKEEEALPRFGVGVCGTASVVRGSGVLARAGSMLAVTAPSASCAKSSGAILRGSGSSGEEEEGGAGPTTFSHRPRMTPSSVSVARTAFSRVEKSQPFIRLVMTRLTRRGATSPARALRGGGAEAEDDEEAEEGEEGDAMPSAKKPVTAPAMHSWRNDMRSQNSSGVTLPSSPSGLWCFSSLSFSDLSSLSLPACPFSSMLRSLLERVRAKVPLAVRLRFSGDFTMSPSVVCAISSMNRDLGSSSNQGM